MTTIALVRHPVEDFDAWKKVYDTFASVQAEHGVHAHQVLRSIENPNDVIVTHTFDSTEAAKAFFAMPELKGNDEPGGRRCRLCSDLVLLTRSRRARWSASSRIDNRAAQHRRRGPAHL